MNTVMFTHYGQINYEKEKYYKHIVSYYSYINRNMFINTNKRYDGRI